MTTVTVTTQNNRLRTYRFNNEADAIEWVALLGTFDPKTAATAVVAS